MPVRATVPMEAMGCALIMVSKPLKARLIPDILLELEFPMFLSFKCVILYQSCRSMIFVWREERKMSLQDCPKCGKEISDKVIECVHCGYPLRETKIENSYKPVIEPISICQQCHKNFLL